MCHVRLLVVPVDLDGKVFCFTPESGRQQISKATNPPWVSRSGRSRRGSSLAVVSHWAPWAMKLLKMASKMIHARAIVTSRSAQMAQMAMAARGENFSTLVGVRVLDFSDPSAVGKEMGLLQGDAKSKLLDPKSGAFGGPPKHTSTSTSAADCLKSQNISQSCCRCSKYPLRTPRLVGLPSSFVLLINTFRTIRGHALPAVS